MCLDIDSQNYWLCSYLHQAKREMVSVLFALKSFGVKNLTGTNWTMKARQYCSLVWIPECPMARVPWTLLKLVLPLMSNSLKGIWIKAKSVLLCKKWSQHGYLDCRCVFWYVYYVEHWLLCSCSLFWLNHLMIETEFVPLIFQWQYSKVNYDILWTRRKLLLFNY